MTVPASIIPFVSGATMTRYSPQNAVEPQVLDMNQLLILDPAAPMAIARQFVAAKYMVEDQPTLYRYRDEFFKFSGSSYRIADSATIRAEVYSFLEGAHTAKAGTYAPFKPKKAVVDHVVDALHAICNVDPSVETPAWLDGAAAKPPAPNFSPSQMASCTCRLASCTRPRRCISGSARPRSCTTPMPPNRTSGMKFLRGAFDGDFASIDVLQDMMGYLPRPRHLTTEDHDVGRAAALGQGNDF